MPRQHGSGRRLIGISGERSDVRFQLGKSDESIPIQVCLTVQALQEGGGEHTLPVGSGVQYRLVPATGR